SPGVRGRSPLQLLRESVKRFFASVYRTAAAKELARLSRAVSRNCERPALYTDRVQGEGLMRIRVSAALEHTAGCIGCDDLGERRGCNAHGRQCLQSFSSASVIRRPPSGYRARRRPSLGRGMSSESPAREAKEPARVTSV